MPNTSNTAIVINDLIQINNDRIEGYKKTINRLESTDIDLRNLFTGFISQSEELKSALQSEVLSLGEEIDGETTALGKIYQTWMDLKAAFTADDRQTALHNCEFGEDAAQIAYRTAEREEDLVPKVRSLITHQKIELKSSHDKIKVLRERSKS